MDKVKDKGRQWGQEQDLNSAENVKEETEAGILLRG